MDPFDLREWPEFIQAGGNPSQAAITDQIVIDSRLIDSPNALFIPLRGKIHDGYKFIDQAKEAGARYILVDKNWDNTVSYDDIVFLRVEDTLRAFQAIAAAYRKQLSCKIVSIAGSFGKTMVKDLLQTMLATTHSVTSSPESFNSQIGVPLSLLTINKTHKIALIEAAISHEGEMAFLNHMINPDCGILTHIGKKHIATLGSLQTVAREMAKLFKPSNKKEWAVLPKTPHLLPFIGSSLNHHFWNEPTSNLPHAYFLNNQKSSLMPYQIDFPDGNTHFGYITSGFYYFLDLVNMTAKAAWLLGTSSQAISLTLKNYNPEPIRSEIWKSPLGSTIINDTYCSNPYSINNALKHFNYAKTNARKIFIFGGMRGNHPHLEKDYKRIGRAIQRAHIDKLYLFGSHNFTPLINELSIHSPQITISQNQTFENSLQALSAEIKSDDFVLIKGEKKQSIDVITEAFNDSISSNQFIINLAAIGDNVATIRKKLPQKTRMMVMVKALAYGTDDVRIAKFLESCQVDILGVSYVDEGVTLKRSHATQAIFVINAAVYEATKVVKWELEIGVSDKALIEAVAEEAEKQNKKIKVHLHIDTGMSRFGCRQEEALELALLINSLPSLIFEGIMTHFACADDPSQDAFTLSQAHAFDQTVNKIAEKGICPPWIHAANSSASLRFQFPQYNMTRVGLAVYGLHPSTATKQALDLRLAISLTSRIVGINNCKLGESISYGRTYSVKRDVQKVAVLPIGYFDGLHRNYSEKGVVMIRGEKAPMVGKICMDFMMVDVTDIPHASPGDSVLIFGEDEYGHYLSPEELASSGGSIIHELITCLGPRIQRIFVHEEAHRNY